MKKAKIYISILFALIFVFPSVYQAGHVVHKHWQKSEVHHCSCKHDVVPAGKVSFTYPQKTEEACAVCEFEFAVFNSTNHSVLQGVAFNYFDMDYPLVQNFVSDKHIFIIKLRGPPHHLFT